MKEALLDTDILNEVLKQKSANVIQNASKYLQEHQQFSFSSMTRYEISRGLKFKNATRQLQNYSIFCDHSVVYQISDAILERASDLWVAGVSSGHPHNDADLIIAATALEFGFTLVTGNTKHFSWIPRLTVEDWRQP